jgi:hypothetical protein
MSKSSKSSKKTKNNNTTTYIEDESIHYLEPDKYPMTDERFFGIQYDMFIEKLREGPDVSKEFLERINKENEMLNKKFNNNSSGNNGGSIKRNHRSNTKRNSKKTKKTKRTSKRAKK